MYCKFLRKLDEDDINFDKGAEVAGGRAGRFLEKPDIIDIFCRREIPEDQPEIEELIAIHFAKMYDPIRRKAQDEDQEFSMVYLTLKVSNRVHLAKVIKYLRPMKAIKRITRYYY